MIVSISGTTTEGLESVIRELRLRRLKVYSFPMPRVYEDILNLTTDLSFFVDKEVRTGFPHVHFHWKFDDFDGLRVMYLALKAKVINVGCRSVSESVDVAIKTVYFWFAYNGDKHVKSLLNVPRHGR